MEYRLTENQALWLCEAAMTYPDPEARAAAKALKAQLD